MRRFNYDDHEDFKEEIDNFWLGEDDSDEPYVEKGDIINMLQIDMVEYELNQRTLATAFNLCKSSFLWRFRSLASKLKMLKQVYSNFSEVLDRNKEELEEEDEENADL